MKPCALLLWLAAYAIAMALVEAAVVVHLRHIYHLENPLALFPLRLLSTDDLALEHHAVTAQQQARDLFDSFRIYRC